ncbi:DUF3429 domain-containing protein [Azohydromonas aeria]|uniref:DUF3429 domain-containing protein n=1 Tax=Azohydromonas aeria TaxID=2590212 RepID=UPI0012FBACA9|nr:DUF3429 domain-containing protein [Azohydromonas aeria]
MSSPVVAPSGPYVPTQQALQLGYAGLIPFVFGALLVWLLQPDAQSEAPHGFAVAMLSGYAAVIVSFLGGIHWGLGFIHGQPRLFVWGVVPSLVAWVAQLMRADATLVLLGVMLVACYLVDRRVYPVLGLKGWLTLRFRLTAIGALCCFLGAAGA